MDGQFDGHGVYTYKDGSIYIGLFKRSKRYGLGKFTYADGDIFEGEWMDDRREGPGTLTRISAGEIIVGVWRSDCLQLESMVDDIKQQGVE